MSLADVSQVFNTIQQSKDNAARAAALKQQQQQFDRSQDLQEKQLDLEHSHQQATLAALQAYQRTQQFNELATNPQSARAQGQVVDQQYAQPMTQGPTNDLAAQPPVSQTLSVPSQVPGQQPFTLNLPTREAEAEEQGKEAGIKNKPLYDQQTALETQKADAEERTAQWRAYLDHQHDMEKAALDRQSVERVAQMNNAARFREEQMRSGTEYGVEKLRQQGLYDPNRVNQMSNDLYNGDATAEDFAKSPLSKYEKENTQSSLAAAGVHPLSKTQSDYLNEVSVIKNIVPAMQEFIANQPDTAHSTSAYIKGHAQMMPGVGDPKQQQRLQELQSGFGNLTRVLSSGVGTARLPQFEAQKIMGFLPDPGLPREENLKKYNDFVTSVGNNLNTYLSNIPPDQRTHIVDKRIGTDLFKKYVDVKHMQAGQAVGASTDTGRITVKDAKGNVGTVPKTQLQDALKSGYTQVQ